MDPETGRIKLIWELIAGGTAGGCQVVRLFTCISVTLSSPSSVGFYKSLRDSVSYRLPHCGLAPNYGIIARSDYRCRAK